MGRGETGKEMGKRGSGRQLEGEEEDEESWMVEGRTERKELMVGERVSKRQTDRDKEETERQRQRERQRETRERERASRRKRLSSGRKESWTGHRKPHLSEDCPK